jgi:lincosamide nucleotidyltransferase A/C/D/E
MSAATATRLLGLLAEHRVDACVGGGWAVDALLGRQTRDHTDLDLWLPADDLEAAFRALAVEGVDRVYPWPGDRPWNFVLHDGGAVRVDLHLYEPISEGQVFYGSVVVGDTFPAEALAGRGVIAGRRVRCEAPEWAVRWHTGYPPRESDRHDVALLCARFGVEPPDGFR